MLPVNTGGTIQEEGTSLLGAVMLCFLFLLQLHCCQRPLGKDTLALASIKGQWLSCWWIPAESCRYTSRQLLSFSPPPFWPSVSRVFFLLALLQDCRSTSLPSTRHQIPLWGDWGVANRRPDVVLLAVLGSCHISPSLGTVSFVPFPPL